MNLKPYTDLICSRIKAGQKLSLEDIETIKACIQEFVGYLEHNDTIPKETAKEIITFIDFTKRITFRANIFLKTVNNSFYGDAEKLNMLMYAYKQNNISDILLNNCTFEKFINASVLDEEVWTLKSAMNVLVKDYIYAREVYYAIAKSEAYTAISTDIIQRKDIERYRMYAEEVLESYMDIRYYVLEHHILDHSLIKTCLQKMQGVMQKTEGETVDAMDFIEIVNIYNISTVFMFDLYTENIASMDFFVNSLKEVIGCTTKALV